MSNRGAVLQGIGIGDPINFDSFQRGQQIALQREQNKTENARYANAEAERKAKEAESRSYRNQEFLKDATNPADFKTGSERLDAFAVGKLQQIKDEFTANAGSMDINTLAGKLQERMGPIIAGHAAAKQKISQELAKVNAAAAQNKNLNKEALLNDVYKGIGDHYIVPDANGQLSFKPIDQTDESVDYTGQLLSAPDYHKYALGTEPLTKFLSALKGEDYSATMQNPDKSEVKWKGQFTPFQKPNVLPDASGLVKQKPAFEYIKETENGIDMLPVNQFQNLIYDTPEKKVSFDLAADAYKKAHGLRFDNADAEDKFRRAFALKELVVPYVKNQVNSDRTHLPPQPRVTINTGGSKKGDGESGIRDVYKEINSEADREDRPHKTVPLNELSATAQGVVLKYANELTGSAGDTKLTQGDIYIKKDENGKLNIMDRETDKVIAPIDFKDVNMQTQPGIKEKRAVLKKGETGSGGGYKIKGKAYTEKQLLDMGYTAEQIKPYKN